jgi:cyclopropane fatty-acyl-phospholipid synthase-like methyltransferase
MRLEDLAASTHGRLMSPSAQRNKEPIARALSQILPETGLVLEVGSGTGEHVVHFARVRPDITWQPSEVDADCLRSIAGWVAFEGVPNVRLALHLDVNDVRWPIDAVDAIVSINMIHIAPWSATQALLRGASLALRESGLVCLYGPYQIRGKHTSESNRAFDAQLRAENIAWGVRDLNDVEAAARAVDLEFVRTFEMPANNLIVAFRKREMCVTPSDGS